MVFSLDRPVLRRSTICKRTFDLAGLAFRQAFFVSSPSTHMPEVPVKFAVSPAKRAKLVRSGQAVQWGIGVRILAFLRSRSSMLGGCLMSLASVIIAGRRARRSFKA